MPNLLITATFCIFLSCTAPVSPPANEPQQPDTTVVSAGQKPISKPPKSLTADLTNVSKEAIVSFAETLQGTPYHEAGTEPAAGFDCSGFITYVFNHFGAAVPRSSVDFTHEGTEIPLPKAQRGDLILFTGTDSSSRVLGHMGIVTGNTDSLRFIHSTSGKKYGVTVTAYNDYYKKRFVKVIDLWPRP